MGSGADHVKKSNAPTRLQHKATYHCDSDWSMDAFISTISKSRWKGHKLFAKNNRYFATFSF